MSKNSPRRSAEQAQKRLALAEAKQRRARAQYFKQKRAAQRRASDAELRSILRAVKGKGIYDPKSARLTKYRRTKLRKIQREFGDSIDRSRFFFLTVPKSRRKEVRERAPAMGFQATRTGLFVPRDGYKRAKLVEGKRVQGLVVKRTGRRKKGPLRTKKYSSALPIAPADEVERQLDRIREAADTLLPLRGKEQLVFIVNEKDHMGYSRKPQNSIEGLVNWLNTYRQKLGSRWTRSLPDFINFLTLVEVLKTGSEEEWNTEHPPPPIKPKRRRSRTAYERATRGG